MSQWVYTDMIHIISFQKLSILIHWMLHRPWKCIHNYGLNYSHNTNTIVSNFMNFGQSAPHDTQCPFTTTTNLFTHDTQSWLYNTKPCMFNFHHFTSACYIYDNNVHFDANGKPCCTIKLKLYKAHTLLHNIVQIHNVIANIT